jgi:hypothetical protein
VRTCRHAQCPNMIIAHDATSSIQSTVATDEGFFKRWRANPFFEHGLAGARRVYWMDDSRLEKAHEQQTDEPNARQQSPVNKKDPSLRSEL